MEIIQPLLAGLNSETTRGADCGFRSTANQGGARRGLCLRSPSTSTALEEEDDEFLQAVPQLYAMEERASRSVFRRSPEMLEFSLPNERACCEPVLREQAGFLVEFAEVGYSLASRSIKHGGNNIKKRETRIKQLADVTPERSDHRPNLSATSHRVIIGSRPSDVDTGLNGGGQYSAVHECRN